MQQRGTYITCRPVSSLGRKQRPMNTLRRSQRRYYSYRRNNRRKQQDLIVQFVDLTIEAIILGLKLVFREVKALGANS